MHARDDPSDRKKDQDKLQGRTGSEFVSVIDVRSVSTVRVGSYSNVVNHTILKLLGALEAEGDRRWEPCVVVCCRLDVLVCVATLHYSSSRNSTQPLL